MEWGDGYCRGGTLPPTVRICTVPERRSLKKTGALAPVLKFLSCFSSAQAPYPSFLPKAAKTRSFRCVSSSHRTRFAGLRREPCFCPPQSRRNPRKSARKRLEILLWGQGHRPAPKEATQRLTGANTGVHWGYPAPPVFAVPLVARLRLPPWPDVAGGTAPPPVSMAAVCRAGSRFACGHS